MASFLYIECVFLGSCPLSLSKTVSFRLTHSELFYLISLSGFPFAHVLIILSRVYVPARSIFARNLIQGTKARSVVLTQLNH